MIPERNQHKKFEFQAGYNYASAFNIDPRNGQISVNEPLSYTSAAVIILTVKVTDKNAEGETEQTDKGKVTFRNDVILFVAFICWLSNKYIKPTPKIT